MSKEHGLENIHEIIDQQNGIPLNLDDSFKFNCKICGSCCRNRGKSEAIVLTGFDCFRIAKNLNMSPKDMIQKYCLYCVSINRIASGFFYGPF